MFETINFRGYEITYNESLKMWEVCIENEKLSHINLEAVKEHIDKETRSYL